MHWRCEGDVQLEWGSESPQFNIALQHLQIIVKTSPFAIVTYCLNDFALQQPEIIVKTSPLPVYSYCHNEFSPKNLEIIVFNCLTMILFPTCLHHCQRPPLK